MRDGIFEFASLTLEAGTVLRFIGSNAPRVYVRGEAVIRNQGGIPIASYTFEHGGTVVHLNHDAHWVTDPVEPQALQLYQNAAWFAGMVDPPAVQIP